LEKAEKDTNLMLEEYFASGDAKELISCLKELNAPADYFPEIVNWMILPVLEKKEKDVQGLASLFKSIISDGVITIDHFAAGFKKAMQDLADFAIDLPKAPKYMSILLAHGIADGYLPDTFLNRAFDHIPELTTQMAVEFFRVLGELKTEDLSEKEMFDLLAKFFKQDKRDEASLVNFLTEQKLTYLFPTLTVRSQLENMLKDGNGEEAILKWIEHNTPDLQADTIFARWLIRAVLKECWAKCNSVPEAIPVKDYAKLLRKFLADNNEIQLGCLYEVQSFVHSVGFPKGLIYCLFVALYDNDIILEEAFKQWKDDVDDPTPGKDKAIIQTTKWLAWLDEAEEESDDETPAS